ncbi:MAG: hypothetical protein LBV45_11030 [Xanthomonadaceae bacterium]|jgi:hypothetical protein|nr:hypothetical protein [Xanthomonadaceae bacterium]
MPIDYRAIRWESFRRRIGYLQEGIYRHEHLPCAYIPAHPFGDEILFLKPLRMRPEDCSTVEIWWGIDGDAAVLSCHADPKRGRTLYRARPPDQEERGLYLDALIKAPYVTRKHAEDAISFFVRAGFPDGPHFTLRKGDPPIEFTPS